MERINLNDRIELIKASDDFNKTYEDIDFVINATTKEQYLAFKKFIKDESKEDNILHHESVAYWLFKHRIGCDFENEGLVDNIKLREALDNHILKCWKMLDSGRYYTYGGGGDCMKYEAIPKFKRKVIETYNKFANLPKEDSVKEELHLAALF